MSSLTKITDIINTIDTTTSHALSQQADENQTIGEKMGATQRKLSRHVNKASDLLEKATVYATLATSITPFITAGVVGGGIVANGAANAVAYNSGAGTSSIATYGAAASVVMGIGTLTTGVLSTTTKGKEHSDLVTATAVLGSGTVLSLGVATAGNISQREAGEGGWDFTKRVLGSTYGNVSMAMRNSVDPLLTMVQSGIQITEGITKKELAKLEEKIDQGHTDTGVLQSISKNTQASMGIGTDLQNALGKTFQACLQAQNEARNHSTR